MECNILTFFSQSNGQLYFLESSVFLQCNFLNIQTKLFIFIQILFDFQMKAILQNVIQCFLAFIVTVFHIRKKQNRNNHRSSTQTPGIPVKQLLTNSKFTLYRSSVFHLWKDLDFFHYVFDMLTCLVSILYLNLKNLAGKLIENSILTGTKAWLHT